MSKQIIEIEVQVPEGYTAKFNPETMKVEISKEDIETVVVNDSNYYKIVTCPICNKSIRLN